LTYTTIHNTSFELHPTGALYWPERKLALIADAHLGKVAHFRKHGRPVPIEAITENFKRLDAVIETFDIQELCFLGDLFHSAINTEWIYFEQWVKTQVITLSLVIGNHDIISPERFEQLGIILYKERIIKPFLLTHHPEEREDLFTICGHIHPGIRLKGPGKQTLKLPCIHKKTHQLILPAFGEFTGSHTISPDKEDEIFVITSDEVILVA